MSDSLITTPSSSGTMELDKNQKRAKMISKGIIIAILLGAAYVVLPFFITLATNAVDLTDRLIKLGINLVILGGFYVAYLILGAGLGHWIEKMMSRFLDAVISDRPTESMRIELGKAKHSRDDYSQGVGLMTQTVNAMKTREDKQNQESMDLLAAASVFKKKGDTDNETLARNKAQRRQDSNNRMKDQLAQYTDYLGRLQKLFKALNFFIADQEDLCEQFDSDWKFSKDMRNSMSKAQKSINLIQDDGIFMRAMRIAEDDIKKNLAYAESVMQNTRQIVDDAELKQGIINEKSINLLNRFDSGEFDQVVEMMNKKSSIEDLKQRARVDIQSGPDTDSDFDKLYATASTKQLK